MHKIGDDTSTADVSDEFTEGSPASNTPATIVRANWLNAVQRELINLLTQASVTPDNATYNQIYAALQALFVQFDDLATTSAAGIIETSTDTEALAMSAANRGVTPANLGALVASAAEVLALTINNKFVTPVRHGEFHGRNALVYHSSAQSISDSALTNLAFDSEGEDTDTFHDTSTNNDRITIPTGSDITRVRVTAQVEWASNATGYRRIAIAKNNTFNYLGVAQSIIQVSATGSIYQNCVTPVITVAPDDYFQLKVFQTSGGALNVVGGNYTSFGLQVIK